MPLNKLSLNSAYSFVPSLIYERVSSYPDKSIPGANSYNAMKLYK